MTNQELNRAIYNRLHELSKEYFKELSYMFFPGTYTIKEIENRITIDTNVFSIEIDNFKCSFAKSNVFTFLQKFKTLARIPGEITFLREEMAKENPVYYTVKKMFAAWPLSINNKCIDWKKNCNSIKEYSAPLRQISGNVYVESFDFITDYSRRLKVFVKIDNVFACLPDYIDFDTLAKYIEEPESNPRLSAAIQVVNDPADALRSGRLFPNNVMLRAYELTNKSLFDEFTALRAQIMQARKDKEQAQQAAAKAREEAKACEEAALKEADTQKAIERFKAKDELILSDDILLLIEFFNIQMHPRTLHNIKEYLYAYDPAAETTQTYRRTSKSGRRCKVNVDGVFKVIDQIKEAIEAMPPAPCAPVTTLDRNITEQPAAVPPAVQPYAALQKSRVFPEGHQEQRKYFSQLESFLQVAAIAYNFEVIGRKIRLTTVIAGVRAQFDYDTVSRHRDVFAKAPGAERRKKLQNWTAAINQFQALTGAA